MLSLGLPNPRPLDILILNKGAGDNADPEHLDAAMRFRSIRALPARRSAARRSLIGDHRGAAALEFALVAGPLFAVMTAIFQVTLTFFAQQVLETASEKAVRQLLTGSAQRSGMTRDQFKTLVCSKLPGFMKCANVMINVRAATSFSAADTARPTITYDSTGNPNNTWTFAPGNAGQITVAQVMYIWSVQSGPFGFDISTMSGSRRLLVATSVFKTETAS
jgi:Flp pilus assembly protein TadG